jgi:tellurite resistance protein TerC
MAVLGLRSLYFALAGIVDRFYHLRLALALLLVLIGTKFLLKDLLPTEADAASYTLAAVTFILLAAVVASLIYARRTRDSYPLNIPFATRRLR